MHWLRLTYIRLDLDLDLDFRIEYIILNLDYIILY